jgi:hypothetical protein
MDFYGVLPGQRRGRRGQSVLMLSDQNETQQNRKPEPFPEPFRVNLLTIGIVWRPRRDLNPCYRRERRTLAKIAS